MTEEQELKAKIERANAYREMFSNWAWQDFMNVLEQHRKNALDAFINCDGLSTTPFQLGEVKGILRELDQIKIDLDFITSYQG